MHSLEPSHEICLAIAVERGFGSLDPDAGSTTWGLTEREATRWADGVPLAATTVEDDLAEAIAVNGFLVRGDCWRTWRASK